MQGVKSLPDATSYDILGFCVLHLIYKTILLEFYGKNNLEAARIDQILDTLQDLMTASIPYLAEGKQDKAKKVITNDCPLLCLQLSLVETNILLRVLCTIKEADQPTQHSWLITVFAVHYLEERQIKLNFAVCKISNILARLCS